MARHFIHRQIVELRVPQEEMAHSLEDEVAALCQNDVPELIEATCKTLVSEGVVLCIDRLELDLGQLSAADFSAQFRSAVQHHLRESLAKCVQELRSPDPSVSQPAVSSHHDPIFVLLHYLQHGTLPWSVSIHDDSQPIFTAVRKLFSLPGPLRALGPHLLDGTAVKRLIHELPTHLLAPLLHRAGLRSSKELEGLASNLSHAVSALPSFRRLGTAQKKLLLWQSVIHGNLVDRPLMPWTSSAFQHLAESLLTSSRTAIKLFSLLHKAATMAAPEGVQTRLWTNAILHLASRETPPLPSVHKVDDTWSHLLAKTTGTPLDEVNEVIAPEEPKSTSTPQPSVRHRVTEPPTQSPAPHLDNRSIHSQSSAVPPLPPQATPATKLPRAAQVPQIPPSADSIPVENGGLVLLWPFLNRYFQSVELLSPDSKSFLNLEAAERGVLLLQYLVTGETHTSGALLHLPKLLCGLPFDSAVPLEFEPTARETIASENLLSATIQNVPSWKNLTRPAFREAWLQRTGVLRPSYNTWELHIERRGYDILLEQVPWPIQIVKLPWMDRPVSTLW